jgi:dephospho-CoA kinase
MNKKLIILLSGKISSGKNSFAEILKEELENHFKEKVVLDAFARPLKEMARDAFKPLVDFLNKIFETLLKEKHLDGYSYKEIESFITKQDSWFENKTPISRIILQQLGTEIFREHVDQNYWVELFKKNSKAREEMIIINTDTRFLGEIEYLEACDDINVITIRVERNIERSNAFNEHVSETALDDYKNWDILIRNDGTLEDLKSEINRLVMEGFLYYNGLFSKYIK